METIISGGAPADGPPPIKESDTQNFAVDVIEASNEVPVIVDFWATWCEPCKQLGPMLEKLVTQARGAVRLVKINVDENQALAQQLRVQSIPTVYAFQNGQPVDAFTGAVPESQLKQFIAKLIGDTGPSPIDQALEQAKAALEAGDAGTAANLFGQVLQAEADNLVAVAGLARCAMALGEIDRAKDMLAGLPDAAKNDANVAAVLSAIELSEAAASAGDIGALEDQLADNPGDHKARFDLAMALFAGGHAPGAIEHLLEIVRRDREWNEEAARKQLVKIFEALGPAHEATLKGRRALSSVLFS